MRHSFVFIFVIFLSAVSLWAAPFNGVSDNGTGDLGYYYQISAGKFVNGQTVNGVNNNTPGSLSGTMRFVADDSVIWGRSPSESGNWQKDTWFVENSGIALTMKNGASVVYDNNGIDDGSYGNFYNAQASGTANDSTPGLYRAYSMSNNFDMVYAGYFQITAPTTVTQISGYFDENSGFDRNNPSIKYRVNIWSNVSGDLLPANTGGFDGDILASDSYGGTFATSDSGADRVFSNGSTDDIFRLTYTLSTPLVLQPGQYWFSHDAAVPEPASMSVLGLCGLVVLRRKR